MSAAAASLKRKARWDEVLAPLAAKANEKTLSHIRPGGLHPFLFNLSRIDDLSWGRIMLLQQQ
jgi:hypothetical protein